MAYPGARRLYLVRHADVYNPERVLYGYLPGFHLSERGIRQAHALGQFFSQKPIKRIYSSPLQRAFETAEIIATYLPKAKIQLNDDLIESYFNKQLQGVQIRNIIFRRPQWLIHFLLPGWLHSDEKISSMAARVRRPLQQFLNVYPVGEAVFVSHGDPIQALWVELENRKPQALHRLQCDKGGRLELDFVGPKIVRKVYIPAQEAITIPTAVASV